jgi:electron transport complex protein RnfB
MDIYHKLRQHLDDLPGGYPPTESGVELRILRRLFTAEEAALALHLTLLEEEAPVIARRAKIKPKDAVRQLEEMARKGLIFGSHRDGRPPRYQAAQFVVGIWEFQVNRLNPGLIRDFEEYLPSLLDAEAWESVPQIRTIPVGESVDAQAEVMAYERAEELVRAQSTIAVAPCICRQEKRLVGEGCDKPLEDCLSYGGGARYYVRTGRGRPISRDEALAILKRSEEAGLVLQPGNAQRAMFI